MLEWSRPASNSAKIDFRNGFTTSVDLIGSVFNPLPPAQLQENGTVTLGDGDLPSPISKSVVVTANHTVVVQNPGTDRLAMKIAATGLFTGTFLDGPATSRAR